MLTRAGKAVPVRGAGCVVVARVAVVSRWCRGGGAVVVRSWRWNKKQRRKPVPWGGVAWHVEVANFERVAKRWDKKKQRRKPVLWGGWHVEVARWWYGVGDGTKNNKKTRAVGGVQHVELANFERVAERWDEKNNEETRAVVGGVAQNKAG